VQRGADCIVLDDGYQHRRLHRDFDILCMDAARPFGTGAVLPAGELREFRSGIRRASLVLLTRASDLDGEFLRTQVERLRELAGGALPVHACEHAPAGLLQRPGGGEVALAELAARPLVLLSAVARPDAFAATVRGLGGRVVRELRYRDHHRFTDAEVQAAADEAELSGAVLLTTEKDDARLPENRVDRWVLRVDLRFLGPEPLLPGLAP
jgi:tetraacyldisaccharide 4'-kinase